MENEDFLRSTGHGREERHEDTRKLVSSRDDSHQEHNLIIRSKVSQLSFFFYNLKLIICHICICINQSCIHLHNICISHMNCLWLVVCSLSKTI